MTDTTSTNTIYSSSSDKYIRADHPAPSIPYAVTSLGQLEPFVEAYFSLYHRSYPIIHEATFRAQFMEVIPRPSGNTWQVLLFVIAAVGAFTTSTQPSDVDLGLFEAAKARMSIDMLETGNLLLVQALALSSNHMQKRNKPNSGYNYMGLARRIAMGTGLHKEFPTWETSLLETEMRRRIWYCLYIFDVGAIITFSRPMDYPQEGIEVEIPLNVHDSVSPTESAPRYMLTSDRISRRARSMCPSRSMKLLFTLISEPRQHSTWPPVPFTLKSSRRHSHLQQSLSTSMTG
jgi:hypothetical protein